MINDVIFKKINVGLRPLDRPIILKTAGGNTLDIAGQLFIPFTMDNQTKIVRSLVVPQLAVDCLCGMDFWNKLHSSPTTQHTACAEE